jgi:hypothetical protein
MIRFARVLSLLAAVGWTGPTLAESDRWGSVDVRLMGYRPNIDAEFPSATPYRDAFGGDRGWMFRLSLGKNIWNEIGTLEYTIGTGYFEKYGEGRSPNDPTVTAATAFKVVPLSVGLSYRFDWLQRRFGVPLAPYARAAFERYNWWILGGNEIAEVNGRSGVGATHGISVTGGLAIELDFLHPEMAMEMDADTGINDTYVFIDFTKSFIDDFGRRRSFDLSDEQIAVAGGFLFAF